MIHTKWRSNKTLCEKCPSECPKTGEKGAEPDAGCINPNVIPSKKHPDCGWSDLIETGYILTQMTNGPALQFALISKIFFSKTFFLKFCPFCRASLIPEPRSCKTCLHEDESDIDGVDCSQLCTHTKACAVCGDDVDETGYCDTCQDTGIHDDATDRWEAKKGSGKEILPHRELKSIPLSQELDKMVPDIPCDKCTSCGRTVHDKPCQTCCDFNHYLPKTPETHPIKKNEVLSEGESEALASLEKTPATPPP
jgi:hypothetical protein